MAVQCVGAILVQLQTLLLGRRVFFKSWRPLGTEWRRPHYFVMDALTLFLFALDFLLAVMLLDAEWTDEPQRRLERVEERRQALRRKETDAKR